MTADSTRQATTVLLVDDEPDIREITRIYLEADGLLVSEAADAAQALERFVEFNPPPRPSIVVLDNRMPGLTGIQVAEKMLSIYPEQVIVLLSAFLDRETKDAASAVGVTACVSKADVRRLPEIIRGLIPAA
jgi:CheY-like chemotaxis protein